MAPQRRTGLLEIILKVEEHSINRFNVAIEWIAGAPCQIEPNERQIAHQQTAHLLIIVLLITDKILNSLWSTMLFYNLSPQVSFVYQVQTSTVHLYK